MSSKSTLPPASKAKPSKTTRPSFVKCDEQGGGKNCKWFPYPGRKYGACSQPGCFGPLIFKYDNERKNK